MISNYSFTSLQMLIEFLELECQQIDPEISWRYYSDTHSPGMSPKGRIETPRGKPEFQANYDVLFSTIYFNLVFIVSEDSIEEAMQVSHTWRYLLTNTIMSKLRKEGYNGHYHGIKLVEWRMKPIVNQDKGATIYLHLLYSNVDFDMSI